MASMLLKPVFKATIGLLVKKGRSLAADKLKDGDVADERFRQLIVREMDDIKSKLDGLAGKDLAASITFFKDGIVHLGNILDLEAAGKEAGDSASTKPEEAVGGIERKDSLLLAAKEMENLQLACLSEGAKEVLSDAKERFKDARRKAIEAFGNSALSTSDRLSAMEIRIMATVLGKIDNPASALASCRLCLEDLHSYSAVRENFSAKLKKGIKESIKSKFGSDERNEIIVAVCQMNRVVYDVTQMVDEGVSKARELLIWPCVDVGEERIDPLRDSRIARKLRKLGMEQFCVQPWSFGQEGEEEHRLESVEGIAINTKGQFIIVNGKYVKVFDSSGKFLNSFSPPGHDKGRIKDVATDGDDNLYVLVQAEGVYTGGGDVYVFDRQTKLHHSFRIRPGYDLLSLVVDVSNKVLVSVTQVPKMSPQNNEPREVIVEMYENRRLRHRIEVMCKDPCECLISNNADGHVMVLDGNSHTLYLFSPQKDYPLEDYPLKKKARFSGALYLFSSQEDFRLEKKVQLKHFSLKDTPGAMTFHQASEHLFIASVTDKKSEALQVSLYNKDGEFVRSIPLETEPGHKYKIKGILVTNNGRIAIAVSRAVIGSISPAPSGFPNQRLVIEPRAVSESQNRHIILIV